MAAFAFDITVNGYGDDYRLIGVADVVMEDNYPAAGESPVCYSFRVTESERPATVTKCDLDWELEQEGGMCEVVERAIEEQFAAPPAPRHDTLEEAKGER